VDTAARLGGDEFCVLAPEQDSKSATILAGRLATAARDEIVSPDETAVGLSIGVASCPQHGDSAEALIDTADRAMYRAKAAGESVAVGDDEDTEVAEKAKG
jgi:diguanylate cyclase (GGDEF)-like protein